MAHLLRLIGGLLAVVLFASTANALIPPAVAYRGQYTSGGGPSYSTCEAAADADMALLQAGSSLYNYARTGPCGAFSTANQALFPYTETRRSNGSVGNGNSLVTRLAASCPANSTSVTGGCKCATGYAELSGTSCVVDNGCMTVLGMTPPNSGACIGGNCQYGYKVAAGEAATAQPFGRFCNAGCTVKGELDFCGQYSSGVMVAGQGVCQVSKSYYTGDKCTGSGAVSGPSSQGTEGGTTTNPTNTPVPEANPVAERLPEGKCPGQVNGVDVVVDCGSTAAVDKKASDGKKVNPDGSNTPNASNSTTTTTTICNGNSCQKITTVTNGGSGPNGTGPGSSTTTTKEEGTKAEICKDNASAACKGDDKKPNGFGGSCAGGFKAVSEDAVINAMAEETFRQNCKVNPDDASQTLGREEAAKTGNQTGNNPNNGNVSIGAGSFDSSNALGGVASCIADKTIVVMGRSINIAFSMICQYLEALGLVMLGVASLLALRIVTRG